MGSYRNQHNTLSISFSFSICLKVETEAATTSIIIPECVFIYRYIVCVVGAEKCRDLKNKSSVFGETLYLSNKRDFLECDTKQSFFYLSLLQVIDEDYTMRIPKERRP